MCSIYVASWVYNMRLSVYECKCSVFCGGGADEYAISICMGMQHKCAAFMLQLGCAIWDWVYVNVNTVYFVEVALMDMQYQYAVSCLQHGDATYICRIYVAAWVCNMRLSVNECKCSVFCGGSADGYAMSTWSVFFATWACNIYLQHLCCSLGVQYEIECIWM